MSRPQLTDHYRRARRTYGLFSALLLGWELVGIKLSEVPLTQVELTIEAPEVAPYTLLLLTLYFAYRTSMEWSQSPEAAKERTLSQIDLSTSHTIAIVSVYVFMYQQIYNEKLLASLGVGESFLGSFLLGFLYGASQKITKNLFEEYERVNVAIDILFIYAKIEDIKPNLIIPTLIVVISLPLSVYADAFLETMLVLSGIALVVVIFMAIVER